MLIVLAWTTEEMRRASNAMVRADLGERHKMEAYTKGHAVTWLLKGTEADVAKAKAFGESDINSDDDKLDWSVFTFTEDEQDPLGKARALILER